MSVRLKILISVGILTQLLLGFPAHALVVTLVPNTVYSSDTAAMDAALGITGLNIEDFEDVNLVAGLSIQHTNPNAGPTNTLPALYFDGSGPFSNNFWDATGALVNTFNNVIWYPPVANLANISSRVTFDLSSPVTTFGVGLGNFQQQLVDHAVLVDGVEVVAGIENLTGYTDGVNVRNGYLKIEAGAGESFSSVAIQMYQNGTKTPVNGANSDGLIFDHLAFGGTPLSVPEPATLLLLGLGLAGLGWRRRIR